MKAPDIQSEHTIETYKSLIHFGTFGLKFVQVVNGGAAIALLAFMGDASKSAGGGPDLVAPMFLFILGVFLGGIATVTSYLTQLKLYNEALGDVKPGRHIWLLWISISLLVLGLLSFAAGAMCAALRFST